MIVEQRIDNVLYHLKEERSFEFLHQYGEVFSCIDQTGSGSICFGVRGKEKDLFFKIAGALTMEAEISNVAAIELLKSACIKYRDLTHPDLISLLDDYVLNDLYIAVFEFTKGDCLFDHWNFEYYDLHPEVKKPIDRFKELSIALKMNVADKLIDFVKHVISKGYLLVDFYDSSIMYDFDTNIVKFCDIDLFEKAPHINNVGIDYFGTKRLKAPEENVKGAIIDEQTSCFTLAAIIFDLFSNIKNKKERYKLGMFIPNAREDFTLSETQYDVLFKATSYDKQNRYKTISDFKAAWNKAK